MARCRRVRESWDESADPVFPLRVLTKGTPEMEKRHGG